MPRSKKDKIDTKVWVKLLSDALQSKKISEPAPQAGKTSRRTSKKRPDKHWRSYDNFGKSRHAYLLFMDIVGYSKLKTAEEQRSVIGLLNNLVRKALKVVKQKLDEVICLPTGDGMCLCFVQQPENSLKVAEHVQRAIWERKKRRETPTIEMRMGVHCGIVVRVKDLKGGFNLVGDAINVTQRAMDSGKRGHILCTNKAFAEFGKLGEQYRKILRPAGTVMVKHRKKLTLYNYIREDIKVGNAAPPRNNFVVTVVSETNS